MNFILVALVAYFIWAVANVVSKALIEKLLRDWLFYWFVVGFINLVVLLLVFLVPFSLPSGKYILLALAVGALRALGLIPYFKALSLEEVSRIIPVWHLTPVFVFALAFIFLGETLGGTVLVGFLLLVSGGIIVSVNVRKGIRLSKAFYLMLLSSLIIAVSYVLMKNLYLNIPFWSGFLLMRSGGFLATLVLFFGIVYQKHIMVKLRSLTLQTKGVFVANQVVAFGALILINYAVVLGPVSIVRGLGGFQALFVFLMTLFLSLYFPRILKERLTVPVVVTKSVSIALLLLGLWLVYQ